MSRNGGEGVWAVCLLHGSDSQKVSDWQNFMSSVFLYMCGGFLHNVHVCSMKLESIGFLSSCCNISELKSIYSGNRKLVIFVKAPGDYDKSLNLPLRIRGGKACGCDSVCCELSHRLNPQPLLVHLKTHPTPEVTPWRPHQIRSVAFGLKGERTN